MPLLIEETKSLIALKKALQAEYFAAAHRGENHIKISLRLLELLLGLQ